MKKIKVLIADDHPLFRKGLGALITEEPDYDLVNVRSCHLMPVQRVLLIGPLTLES